MLRRLVTLLITLAVAAAGCVSPGASGDDADTASTLPPVADPFLLDHDHQDPTLHESEKGFERVAHHDLGAAEREWSAGAHAVVARDGWLFVATYSSHDTEGGFWIFDVSDPENPEPVGRWQHVGPMGGDRSIHVTPDANFVVIGTESLTCAGHLNPYAPGLYLVDVRDKTNPQTVDHVPDQGVHSVYIHEIEGEHYVFTMMRSDGIYRINEDLPLPRLEQVGELAVGHDIFVMDDPLLGKPILYAADGRGPLNIYDVSDPARPQPIGKWNIPDRGDDYYVHTATAVVTEEGKRLVVVTSEDWGDYASAMWVLDATDFEFIETLSQWENPGEHAADLLRFSLHNPRMAGEDRLYLAHYHGGAWGIDISDPGNPVGIQHYYPNADLGFTPEYQITQPISDERCGRFNLVDVPLVFDVEYYEGILYVADLHTGLYALKPTV